MVAADLIKHAGARRFIDTAAASDTNYYAGDGKHPGVLAARIHVTGRDPRDTVWRRDCSVNRIQKGQGDAGQFVRADDCCRGIDH